MKMSAPEVVAALLLIVDHPWRWCPSLGIVVSIWTGCNHAPHAHHARLVRLASWIRWVWIGWLSHLGGIIVIYHAIDLLGNWVAATGRALSFSGIGLLDMWCIAGSLGLGHSWRATIARWVVIVMLLLRWLTGIARLLRLVVLGVVVHWTLTLPERVRLERGCVDSSFRDLR